MSHTSQTAPIPIPVQSYVAGSVYASRFTTGSRPGNLPVVPGKVHRWLATQSNVQCTPATSTVPAMAKATTEASSMSIGMDATAFWPPEQSQISRRSKSSKRTYRSSMAEVMLNFGTQIISNIMSMAEASRQEAARREELLRQEALAIRQEAVEKEKLAFAREQIIIIIIIITLFAKITHT